MSELLGAQTDVLDRTAESLSADSRRVQDIRLLAQRAVAELQAGWRGSDLIRLSQQWEQQASPLLAAASASLDTCAAQVRAQSSAQRVASSSDSAGLGSRDPMTVPRPMPMAPPPAHPPARASPAAVARWWKSLSPPQQRQMVLEHPEWIGNRDGVSFSARDLANRALLTDNRDRLMSEREKLILGREHPPAAVVGSWSGAVVARQGPALVLVTALRTVNDKLASIDSIKRTLAEPGERQLLLLDLGQTRPLAAIANGNVATADNVAVIVPGVSTSVAGSMQGLDREMRQLRQRSQQESGHPHPRRAATTATTATTATVSWIGYQTPQLTLEVLLPNSTVMNDNMAQSGAAQLAPFLQGIGASREHDAHLTLLGHSYGTTTAGLALRQDTGVDDAVFFGSPGLGTSHLEDLKLAPGHAYYVEAERDAIGDLGHFGIDPSHMDGIKHVSTRESTVVDPATGQTRHLKEVTGHSDYLLDGSTSQYNASVIVAGVPDGRVRDNGQGFGDILSWPIPGTY